jgi:SAM-dependent methyltransferase
MLKHLFKKLLRSAGLELRRIGSIQYGLLPPWVASEPPLTKDEVNKGAEVEAEPLAAEPLANRTYRPPRLAYRRTQYGDDHRLKYILYFLDLRDQRVLELGPFHGVHSFILEKMGVRETVAVEGRESNIDKCMKFKNKYNLDRTTFILQNIERLYNGEEPPHFSGPFDLVFCIGVLYHFPEPAKALQWCRRQAPSLFLGTHYIEKMEMGRYAHLNFDRPYEHQGHEYAGTWIKEHGKEDPPSGLSPESFRPFEEDLLAMVRDAGYSKVSVLGKDLLNADPHITLLAET